MAGRRPQATGHVTPGMAPAQAMPGRRCHGSGCTRAQEYRTGPCVYGGLNEGAGPRRFTCYWMLAGRSTGHSTLAGTRHVRHQRFEAAPVGTAGTGGGRGDRCPSGDGTKRVLGSTECLFRAVPVHTSVRAGYAAGRQVQRYHHKEAGQWAGHGTVAAAAAAAAHHFQNSIVWIVIHNLMDPLGWWRWW